MQFITDLKRQNYMNIVIGLDCKSTDETETLLKKLNIVYVKGSRSGYDPTLLAAYKFALDTFEQFRYILTCDAGGKYDYSSFASLYESVEAGNDLVLGVRIDRVRSMLWHQKIGTHLVLLPCKLIFRLNIMDISSVRLIKISVLKRLNLQGRRFGLPTEIIIKALALRVPIGQVPVEMRKRQGASKVSGSLANSLRAARDLFYNYRYVRYKD